MSIVRIGLSESSKYGSGWDSIFGKGTKANTAVKPVKSSASKKKNKPARKKK
jgi:hypothetical protein